MSFKIEKYLHVGLIYVPQIIIRIQKLVWKVVGDKKYND